MRAVWLAVLAGVACRTPAAPTAHVPSPHPPTLADARAAERGSGQPRDFAKAAEIYSALCADGSGALDACIALDDALGAARGVDRDSHRELALLDTLCQRGDVASCAQSAVYWTLVVARSPQGSLPPDARAKAGTIDAAMTSAEAACGRGDGRSCELTASLSMFEDNAKLEAQQAKLALACRQGRYEACAYLTHDMADCEDDPASVAACEQRVLGRWRSGSDEAASVHAAAAATTLIDGCRAGDAIACSYVPSRRIPYAALCAAHDWSACAQLGCLGDDAAGATARAHGVDERSCQMALGHAMAEWRRAPAATRPRFPPVARDGREPSSASSVAPFEAVRFQHHGGRDRHDWPRFDAYDLGDRPVRDLGVCLYAYRRTHAPGAARDTTVQLARVTATMPVALAPNELAPLALDGAISSALPDGTTDVAIDYDHVGFGGGSGGSGSDDASRCPDQRPFDQQSPDAW